MLAEDLTKGMKVLYWDRGIGGWRVGVVVEIRPDWAYIRPPHKSDKSKKRIALTDVESEVEEKPPCN